jgi:PII-like signaling protein
VESLKLLKVYLGERDRYQHKPLFEHIVEMAYKMGMKGITVYKGIMGFGCKRHLHRSDFFSLSPDLPVVIEVVDDEKKVRNFADEVMKLSFDGLMFITNVEVIVMGEYGTGRR